MKKLIWFVIGAAAIAASGFTYEITRGCMTESVVDVRIVEVGGHEYVVGTSCTPHRASNAGTNSSSTFYGNKSASYSIANIAGGSSSICLVHHVGCRACSGK